MARQLNLKTGQKNDIFTPSSISSISISSSLELRPRRTMAPNYLFYFLLLASSSLEIFTQEHVPQELVPMQARKSLCQLTASCTRPHARGRPAPRWRTRSVPRRQEDAPATAVEAAARWLRAGGHARPGPVPEACNTPVLCLHLVTANYAYHASSSILITHA